MNEPRQKQQPGAQRQGQRQGQGRRGQQQGRPSPQGHQQGRRGQQPPARKQKAKQLDLWRPVPQLPEPEPIVPAADPTALLRSLGDPPLLGQGAVAEHYLAAVVERAAALATALAATAGLLGERDADED